MFGWWSAQQGIIWQVLLCVGFFFFFLTAMCCQITAFCLNRYILLVKGYYYSGGLLVRGNYLVGEMLVNY